MKLNKVMKYKRFTEFYEGVCFIERGQFYGKLANQK